MGGVKRPASGSHGVNVRLSYYTKYVKNIGEAIGSGAKRAFLPRIVQKEKLIREQGLTSTQLRAMHAEELALSQNNELPADQRKRSRKEVERLEELIHIAERLERKSSK